MYTKHPYAERSVISHALAPLFTIHRALKSFKSVWQRGDVDNLCTGKLLIHSYQVSYSILACTTIKSHFVHIFSYLLLLDKVQ